MKKSVLIIFAVLVMISCTACAKSYKISDAGMYDALWNKLREDEIDNYDVSATLVLSSQEIKNDVVVKLTYLGETYQGKIMLGDYVEWNKEPDFISAYNKKGSFTQIYKVEDEIRLVFNVHGYEHWYIIRQIYR